MSQAGTSGSEQSLLAHSIEFEGTSLADAKEQAEQIFGPNEFVCLTCTSGSSRTVCFKKGSSVRPPRWD